MIIEVSPGHLKTFLDLLLGVLVEDQFPFDIRAVLLVSIVDPEQFSEHVHLAVLDRTDHCATEHPDDLMEELSLVLVGDRDLLSCYSSLRHVDLI